MSQKLQSVRGTKDLLFEEAEKYQHIVTTAQSIAANYGCKYLATPIFEFTEVFKRTLGDASDIVTKEMYTFEDRGGNSLTLRPEFTAGIARAFIAGGLKQYAPLKCFSHGPLFRYERPQKGRFRQFHQINVEMLGAATPDTDIEIITLALHILKELGLEKAITLELNSLGDEQSRNEYRKALVDYLNDYQAQLSEDSKKRLKQNPLRILDSKDEGDKKITAQAPTINDYYSAAAQEFFDQVKSGLDSLDIAYHINTRLVRGLDYYCHTIFECTTDQLGAQNAVLAGGRYDGLINTMGGDDTPAIGFAAGIERLMALIPDHPAAATPVVAIPIGEKAQLAMHGIAKNLREQGIYIEILRTGNVKKRMGKAHKMNAIGTLIIGDDELAQKQAVYKEFESGKEQQLSWSQLASHIKKQA